jgi:cellulose biosynthesis protein BcsQ
MLDLQTWIGLVTSLITLIATIVGFVRQTRRLRRIEEQNKHGAEAVRKLQNIRQMVEDESIWSRPLALAGFDYHRSLDRSIPIILVANLKGGVGKTTIAANLATYFASARGERVLIIDMDYQGSLSAHVLGQAKITDAVDQDREQNKASELLRGGKDGEWVVAAREVDREKLAKLKFIAANSSLADLENRLQIKWLLEESEGDPRLSISKVLHSAQVQGHFDRIFIDTAPRLTLAFVASACASTHVLIPTLLNEGSSRSVLDALKQIDFLRKRICGHLQVLGIVGSKTYRGQTDDLTLRERGVLDNLQRDIYKLHKRSDLVLTDAKIRSSASIEEAAGKSLVVMHDVEADSMFKALGEEVARRAPSRRKS